MNPVSRVAPVHGCALAAMLALSAAQAATYPTLLGYWPTNEGSGTTIYDFSANLNDGTFAATTHAPTWSTGHTGSDIGLAFSSAAAQYLTIPDNASLHVGNSSNKPFTIGWWAYDNYSYYGTAWCFNSNNSTGGRGLFAQGPNYPADSHIYTTYSSNASWKMTNGLIWTANAWHYLAVTWDGSTIKVFVDPQNQTTPAAAASKACTASLSSWGTLYWGLDYTASADKFGGSLQRMTILDKAVATQADFTSLSAGTHAAQLGYWSGLGADTNWNSSDNWGGALPSTRRPLIFDTSTALTNNNNFSANSKFAGIQFRASAGGFTLNGNALNLTGDVVNNSSAAQTISTPLVLDGGTRTFNAAAGDLSVTAGITQAASQTNGLSKTGANTLKLAGTSTYSGATSVTAGKLLLNAATLANSAVTLNGASAVLAGNGTVTPALALQASATLAPGVDASSVGTINCGGGLSLNAAALSMKLGSLSDQIAVTGDVTLTGATTLAISQAAGFYYGDYTLVSYTGNLLGSGTIQAPTSTSTYGYSIVTSTAHQIILHVYLPPSTKIWNGLAGGLSNGVWNIGSASTWMSAGLPAAYNEGAYGNDPVVFDDNAAGTTDVTLNTTVSPFTITFGNSTKPYTLSGSGQIAGASGLNISGAGSVTLGTANTYSGDTVIGGGTLTLANAGALAGSTLNYNNQGGTLGFGNLTNATLGGLKGAEDLILDNGSAAAITLTVGGNNQNPQYDGVLSGDGSLNKTGTGTLTLTKSATYLGTTTVSGGVLVASALANTSHVNVTSGTLNVQGLNAVAPINVASGATANISGIGQNLAAMTNAGVIAFTAASGTTTLASLDGLGTSTFAAGGSIGTLTGGTVNFNGSAAAVMTLGDATVNLASGTILSVAGGSQTTGTINGSGSLNMNGTGTLTLNGANTYSGNTTVNSGTLSTNSLSSLGSTGLLIVENNATFQYTGSASVTTARWSGSSAPGQAFIDISDSNANFTITDNRSDLQAITKVGAGTLTLSSHASLAGNTGGPVSVTGGTLVLAGYTDNINWFNTASGITDVQTGATLKFGRYTDNNMHNGQIYAAASFHMSGGTFDLNGDGSNTVPVIDGSGFITNNSASAATATLNVNANRAFSGNITDGLGKVTLNLSGGGNTWTLSGVNTYSGATLINGGSLTAGSTSALSPNSSYTVGGSRSLTLASFDNAIGSLSGGGNVVLGTATLTLGSDNTSTTFTGGISSSGGGLVKTGSGTQVLSGSIGYTGDTTVSHGTLQLGNINLANATSTVTIASSGATLNLAFSGSQSVSQLYIGSTLMPAGIYTAIGNAGGTAIAQISGTGSLTVSSGAKTAYANWASAMGLTGEAGSATDPAPSANPTGDGRSNVEKFAFNGNPLNGANDGKVVSKLVTLLSNGSYVFTLTVPVRSGASFSGTSEQVSAPVDGIVYTIQGSTSLEAATWNLAVSEVTDPGDLEAIQAGLPALSDSNWTYRTFRAPGSISPSNPEAFLRVMVSQ